MKWLWTLAMLVDSAHSICFVDTVVGEKGDVFDTHPVIDEIHCKTICADSDKCKSFNFHANICKLFSTPTKTFKCSNPYRELIKKTESSECEDLEVTYSLSENYTSNPDLPVNATAVDVNINSSPSCSDDVIEIDAVLIDGTRKTLVAQQTTTIFWDSKLGVWIYQLNNDIVYLRAAKCVQPPPIEILLVSPETTTTTAQKQAPPATTAGDCLVDIPLRNCGMAQDRNQIQVTVNKATGVITCPWGHSITAGNYGDKNCASFKMGVITVRCVNKVWQFTSGARVIYSFPSRNFQASCWTFG